MKLQERPHAGSTARARTRQRRRRCGRLDWTGPAFQQHAAATHGTTAHVHALACGRPHGSSSKPLASSHACCTARAPLLPSQVLPPSSSAQRGCGAAAAASGASAAAPASTELLHRACCATARRCLQGCCWFALMHGCGLWLGLAAARHHQSTWQQQATAASRPSRMHVADVSPEAACRVDRPHLCIHHA